MNDCEERTEYGINGPITKRIIREKKLHFTKKEAIKKYQGKVEYNVINSGRQIDADHYIYCTSKDGHDFSYLKDTANFDDVSFQVLYYCTKCGLKAHESFEIQYPAKRLGHKNLLTDEGKVERMYLTKKELKERNEKYVEKILT